MRDLHKTLELLSSATPMEYCAEFNEIKSILEYCNKHVKPFNKLHFRGGNESFINELTRRLQDFLVDHNLVNAESKEPIAEAYPRLRKVMMFLLVNTDATYKYNLRDDAELVHVLEICPLLPKFLLVTLVWELKLDSFFYEMLSYTPCWYSFQYFEPAADSLKYIDDAYEVLEKVDQLVRAIYASVTRSELRVMDAVDSKIIYGKLYDYTMNLLRQFYTPDAEKFKKFTKKQFFRYSGFALKHLLELVLFTFDVYENVKEVMPNRKLPIYDICSELCTKVVPKRQESQLLKDEQLKIITALLNTLQYNVMLVKIDVFIYWVEVELSNGENLQMVIGAMAYKIGERMLANPTFAHDVVQQLKIIAIRPKTLEETVRDATIGEILNSLDDITLAYHIKKVWFDELLSRKVALGNDECLQSIRDNVKLMSVENCQQILDFIKLEIMRIHEENLEDENERLDREEDVMRIAMEVDNENYEELTTIVLLSLQHFNGEQLLTLNSYQTKLFGDNVNICCRSDCQSRLTEFLNKSAADAVFDLQQFLILCFEQPSLVWSKFFDCVCNNLDYIRNYCMTVQQTRPFSNVYFQSHLQAAMSDSSRLQETHFPALLSEIYFVLYNPERKTEFLKQIIHKSVNSLLDGQQFESLLPIVKALNMITSHGDTQSHKPLNFGEVTAPVLLMAAQIMDKARWDLITYSDVRDEVVRECVQFIQQTSKKFLPVATEKDRKWITKVIKDSYKPITQYYFQKFALAPDQRDMDFDRFLIRLEIEDKSEAEMFLIINYVRCTMKESEWLARSERLLPHISDVMLILGGVVKETENGNAVDNYRHCLANYANIVQKFLLPTAREDNKQIEKLVIKVLRIIASTPEQIYEQSFISFESVLLDIVDQCRRPLDPNTVKSVRKFVENMKDCSAKSIFLNKFQAMVTELT